MAEQEFTTEELKSEEWRPVVGYEGHYSVSNLGRVMSHKTYRCIRIPNQILKGEVNHGYKRVGLSLNGKRVHRRVQRLVAAAFIGPCPEGSEVNHKKRPKTNNRVTNLEYRTPKGNRQHAAETGLIPKGENNGFAKLTLEEVASIRAQKGKKTQCALAKEFHCTQANISLIQRGEHWKEA